MMYTDAPDYTINGVTAQLSLLEAWVETVVQEFVRLYVPNLESPKFTDSICRVKWPLITYKHDDVSFLKCNYVHPN